MPAKHLLRICGYLLIAMVLVIGVGTQVLAYLKDHVRKNAELALEVVPPVDRAVEPIEEITPTPKPLRLLVAGDLMFDRHIRQHATERGNDYIFGNLKPLFTQMDMVMVNVEGPITDNSSRSVNSQVGSTNNFIFTFPVSLVKTLYDHNIRVVNLGNNHILNFGQAGAEETAQHLTKGEIAFFGYVNEDTHSIQPSLITEIAGVKVGWVNYNQFANQDKQQVLALLRELKPQVDLLLLYTHWDNEYQKLPARVTVELAHAAVEAGADAVIGSHPHVIQSNELYQGKPIYYSLGNFVFDQYFEPAVKKGLMLELQFEPTTKALTITEHFVELLSTGQTMLLAPSRAP